MPIVIVLLLWAVGLGLVHLLLTGLATTQQLGSAYGMGARDEPKTLVGVPARLSRAYDNYLQSFPYFAAVALASAALDRSNPWIVYGAYAYLVARIAYVPVYAAGIPVVRTLIWAVSLLGIAGMVAGLS